MKIFQLVIFILFLSMKLSACDCSGSTVDIPYKSFGLGIENSKSRENSDSLVFEGILISISHDTTKVVRDYELKFEMTDNYKGSCIDTVSVWTNHTRGGCGFRAKIGTYSIIHARFDLKERNFYTYRADCFGAGASEYQEKERYNRHRNFYNSIKYGLNGDYKISQRIAYWKFEESSDNMTRCLEYSISENQLNGDWNVYDKNNNLIEKGNYKNGLKFGEWIYLPKSTEDIGYVSYKYDTIYYQD